MTRSSEIEIKVGIFVAIGLGLVMFTILILGGGQIFFQRGATFHTRFHESEGLVEGATVKMAGVRVGQVQKILLDNSKGDVDVYFTVQKKFQDAVRQDSIVGIQTQGVLGDRYLVINVGTPSSPEAPANSELANEPPRELKDYLDTADEVLDHLKGSLEYMQGILGNFHRDGRSEVFFKNLTSSSANLTDGTKSMKDSMARLHSIITKIDNGQGTIGSLVNDPSLYDDLKALLGGANRNRVLKYFIKKSVEESRDAPKK